MLKNKLNSFVHVFVLSAVFVFAAFNLFGLSYDSLTASGWVNDFAGIIDEGNKAKLTSLIGELNQKTSAEIAVVTLSSLEGEEISDFTLKLFTKWGIGKKGKDNGIMILTAVAERKVWITTGYGVEGVIPDSAAGEIIRSEMLPRFKSGDMGGGIYAGAYAIAMKIAAEQNVQLTGQYVPVQAASSGVAATPLQKLFSLIFIIVMIIVFIRHPWLFLLLLSTGRYGGGGGGFGGGGGGGFGGFGGGSSGGGGAGGSW